MRDPAGRGEEALRAPQHDTAHGAHDGVEPARRAPGRSTLVERDVQGARSAPQGGAPGRTTLVEHAAQAPGRGAEVAPDAAFETAVADVRRHTAELEAALASGDSRRAREPAHALERALAVAREHAANTRGPAAAQRMGVIAQLTRVAEPLLARARGDQAGGVHEAAARGVQGQGSPLPHLDAIQRSFGRHDISRVQAHHDEAAASASRRVGAEAYTTGDHVAFAGAPSLHTAAHEAAHVVQQRQGGASGVQLKALDGGSGDVHERHADAVADAVVAGRSAEGLLDRGPGGSTPAVQRKSDPPKPGDGAAPGAGGAQDRGGRPPKGSGKPPADQPATGEKSAKPGAGGPRSAGGGGGGGGGAAFSGGGIDGKPLKAQIVQFNQGVTQNQGTIQNPAGENAKPKKDSQEDHDKKVKQYEDGIDGIASMIGDLDAFDELCSGFSDWGEDKDKQQKGMAGVRASKPFAQLTKMWQGALDGGPDSAKMQAAFDREFTRRGFWGSTQRAYDLVREEAKQQAKEDAAAAAAKKKAQDALGKKPPDGGAAGASAGKTEPGKGHGTAINGGAAGAAGGAGVNAVVQEQAAPLPNFLTMSKVSDADMQKLMASVENRQGLLESAPKMGAQDSRFTQIMAQLKRAGGGFVEGFVDTVKWGVVANVGEKLVGGIVEKGLGEKVPIVGPVIMLALQPPWKADYWTGKGGVLTGLKTGGEHFAHMGKDLAAFKDVHSAKDALGVFCALVADLFAGIHDVLNAINTVLGTLSALCLILGAVLIGVGIALCWLGIGEALMAAGGWLVEAGETLGDISMALIPVCLALSAITLVFRTAAAAMVPAELYASQLAEEGDAAEEFGNAAGQKIGLDTSRTIEEATAKKTETKTSEGDASTATAKGQGEAEGAQVTQHVAAETTALQETAAHAEAHGKEAGGPTKPEPAKPEPAKHEGTPGKEQPPAEHAEAADKHGKAGQDAAEANKPEPQKKGETEPQKKGGKQDEAGDPEAANKPGEDKEDKPGDEDDKADKGDKKNKVTEKAMEIAGDLFRRIGESIKTSVSVGRNLRRLRGAVEELGELRHGRATAEKGLETVAEQSREVFEEMSEKAKAAQEQIDQTLEKLKAEEGKLTEEETAKLNKQLADALDAWGDAKTTADRLEKRLAKIAERQKSLRENAEKGKPGDKPADDPADDPKQQQPEDEGSAAEDEDGEPKSSEEKRRHAEDEARAKRQELDKAKKEAPKLEAEKAEAEKTLEAAKARKAEADEQMKAALDKLAKDPQAARKRAAVKTVEAHERAVEKAKGLRDQADRLDAAETNRTGAMQVLDKTVGSAVEVGGETCKIVGFSADGVLVEPAAGGARRAVPADEVKGELPADFKDQVQRVQQANQTLSKELGSPGQDPAAAAQKLRDDASAIDADEHKKREGSNKKRQTWEKDQKLAAQWKADHARAEAPAKEADAAFEQAEKDYDKKKEAVAENQHERQDLEREVHEQEEEAAELRREGQRHRRSEKAKEKFAEWFGQDFAPDAWDWLKQVLGLEDKLRETQQVVAGKKADKEEPGTSAPAGDHDDKAKQAAAKPADEAPAADHGTKEPPAAAKVEPEGPEKKKEGEGAGEDEKKKLHDEAMAIARAKVLYQQALALPPPADIGQLGDHRKKATDAANLARDKHSKAYQCYQGELAVAKLAQDTGQLAEHGKPLHKRAQQMAAPIEKSKADEASRATTLAGAQTGDVKGSDSRMGGLVVGLISKLADHSDRLSQKPDAGGASGNDMAGSQDKAAAESTNRTHQTKGMSQSQHQFLDAAQQTRAQQEASVAKNIQGLEAKQHEEQSHLEQIRQNKAQALAEEAQARQQAEAEAATFNAGYARATAWAADYEKRRAELTKASSE